MREAYPAAGTRAFLDKAWEVSLERRIDRGADLCAQRTEADFLKLKKRMIKPYSYSSRFMQLIVESCASKNLGFAYFSPDGILMKLLGSESFLDRTRALGLRRNTDWSFGRLGANAVSLGLEHITALRSIGGENYNLCLSRLALYFSPITLQNPDLSPISYGGIALICPAEEADPAYEQLIRAMVLDVEVHMHMTRTLHSVFSKMDIGMICFDISQLTGTVSITYYNHEIFNVLGIPEEDLTFQRAESVFDAGEANAQLWGLIQELRTVKSQPVLLCVRGVETSFIVTTEVYSQPNMRVTGIRFFVTTPQHDAQQVADKIGGNALMTVDALVGESACFRATTTQLKLAAKNSANVLLLGESGVGKDIIAQAIHNASLRRSRPFIAVNCASLPRDLIASELFGYEEGAFTGAKRNGNIGKFELANTGTIFLDEIGDMPLESQAMLLRVIEQKSFMRIGSSRLTSVDIKIISATNANLEELVERKLFRLDLYYRLGVLKLHIPSLRERGGDILLLTRHFIRAIESRDVSGVRHGETVLSPEAERLMLQLPWRGNVRELQNVIEGIMVLYQPEVIEAGHLLSYLNLTAWPGAEEAGGGPVGRSARLAPKKLTPDAVLDALVKNHYNKCAAADFLGISRKSLYRKLEEFELL